MMPMALRLREWMWATTWGKFCIQRSCNWCSEISEVYFVNALGIGLDIIDADVETVFSKSYGYGFASKLV